MARRVRAAVLLEKLLFPVIDCSVVGGSMAKSNCARRHDLCSMRKPFNLFSLVMSPARQEFECLSIPHVHPDDTELSKCARLRSSLGQGTALIWFSQVAVLLCPVDVQLKAQSTSSTLSVLSRSCNIHSMSLGSLIPQTPPPLTAPFMPTSLPTKLRPTLPGPMPTHLRTFSSLCR